MPSSRSARFVAWANAVALGLASPDLAATEITGADPPHRVDGLPDGDGQTLPVVLSRLRATGRPGARLALPVPGDVAGVPGPGPLTEAALVAGEAVLIDTWGLVPAAGPTRVLWSAYPCAQPPPAGRLAESDQALAEALREATQILHRLDVARCSDNAAHESDPADDIRALRSGRLDEDRLPPGYPHRAVTVLARARRVRAIVRLATGDDGASVSAAEAAARLAALRRLERAARHAEMAAYNALGEPRPVDR